MRRTTAALACLTAVLLVAACSESTLPADDQAFCAEQEDRLGPARDAVQEIIDGDRHWSSDREADVIRQKYVEPAGLWVGSFDVQDERLVDHQFAVDHSLFGVNSDLSDDPAAVFADDAAKAREVAKAIDELQQFCDDNG